MDYSLLLIKASTKAPNKRMLDQDDQEEMMPAMVLMKNDKGEARLELRNSIVLRKPSKHFSNHPLKQPSIKSDTRSSKGTTNYKSAIDHQNEANPAEMQPLKRPQVLIEEEAKDDIELVIDAQIVEIDQLEQRES